MIDTLNKFSETAEIIATFFSIISKSLGFLGLECVILILISFILLFFINQINAIFPKFNYFFVISISLFIGYLTKISTEGIVKYILLMLFPLILSLIINLIANVIKNKLQKSKNF